MSDVVRRVLFEHELQRRGEDWFDRRARERREAREAEERKQQAHEAKRSEQRRRFDAAVDARIDQWAMTKYNEVVAQFTSEYVTKRSKALQQKNAELETQIAELERRLDERRSLGKGFKFARDRGAGEPSLPVRTVQKFRAK